jgi:hypothetical protein
MLSVTMKSIMLSVVMLNIIMLNVVAPKVWSRNVDKVSTMFQNFVPTLRVSFLAQFVTLKQHILDIYAGKQLS